MKGIRPLTATDNCRRDIARDLLADLRRLDRQVKDNEAQMRDALAPSRTNLTSLPGLGTVLAAKVLGHIGDISRFPTEHHFASYVGNAPLGWRRCSRLTVPRMLFIATSGPAALIPFVVT
ncbi:transposase [Streptomyces sp. NBC_00414]|uniref:transposase n=1 Tax=Streptomyces sp. NBC_00414 TaxID=2975739 RepID=UPI002E1DDBD5